MPVAEYRQRVTFQALEAVPDGDGGVMEQWVDLPHPWFVSIVPATVRDLERRAAGTVVAMASHIVTGRYRDDVQIDGRLVWDGREFRIHGVRNIDERGVTMELFVLETL